MQASDDKVKVITAAKGRCHLNVQQVGRIVDAFEFNEDKVTVVKTLRPMIVDPANASVLLDHFEFAADKETVAKLLR